MRITLEGKEVEEYIKNRENSLADKSALEEKIIELKKIIQELDDMNGDKYRIFNEYHEIIIVKESDRLIRLKNYIKFLHGRNWYQRLFNRIKYREEDINRHL